MEGWAVAYTARRPPDAPDELATDFQQALLARIWLRLGRPAEALPLTHTLAAAAQAADRGWTVIQALALQALAHQALDQPAEAERVLAQTLRLALPGGYLRLFLDEGEPMRRLLAQVAQSPGVGSAVRAYAGQVLKAFAASNAPATAPAAQALIEPLSARELEVLRLLAEGQSNREIAETLVISVGTVKSHINHLLGKLDAHSRTQALAHARTLQLV
jgi:LuxR family maltose regulon positive regulatory protein